MKILPPDIYKELPVKIRNVRDIGGEKCAFSVEISWEFAQTICEIAAPFLENLARQTEDHAEEEQDRLKILRSMLNKTRKTNLLALKTMRISRKSNLDIEQAAIKLALKHNMNLEAIVTTAKFLQRERTKRLQLLKNHRINSLYLIGVKSSEIARQLNVSNHIVNKVINENTKRITP